MGSFKDIPTIKAVHNLLAKSNSQTDIMATYENMQLPKGDVMTDHDFTNLLKRMAQMRNMD